MNDLKFFLKKPVLFKQGILVYPPSLNDIVVEEDYPVYIKILCSSQDDIEDDFLEAGQQLEVYPTPLELLLNNCYHSKQYRELTQAAFRFFLKTEVTFLYEKKAILIGSLEEALMTVETIDALENLPVINEQDFPDFQDLICEACGRDHLRRPDPKEHPKAREMRRKARYRDKVKAKENKGLSLFSMAASICCMGIGITPLNIGEMSYAALDALVKRYQEKDQYEREIDTLLAGGDSKKIKPKYWIRNL